MPKYYYSCQECKHTFRAYHSAKDILKTCPECGIINKLVRKVNKVFIYNDNDVKDKNVGDLTNQFIEENKDILKEYKKEIKDNLYDEKSSTD